MTLGIYGIGGVGREILDMALLINERESRWEEIIFVDDNKYSAPVHDLLVLPLSEVIRRYSTDQLEITIAVGEPDVKRSVLGKVDACGYRLANLIHPTAYVGVGAEYGDGLVLREGSKLSVDARVGRNVCFENYAILGHDGVMGDNCQISTFSAIAGNCTIGDRVYFGLGCCVKEGTSIGSDAIIGMGAIVMRDVDESAIMMGNPARKMGNNDSKRVFKG